MEIGELRCCWPNDDKDDDAIFSSLLREEQWREGDRYPLPSVRRRCQNVDSASFIWNDFNNHHYYYYCCHSNNKIKHFLVLEFFFCVYPLYHILYFYCILLIQRITWWWKAKDSKNRERSVVSEITLKSYFMVKILSFLFSLSFPLWTFCVQLMTTALLKRESGFLNLLFIFLERFYFNSTRIWGGVRSHQVK